MTTFAHANCDDFRLDIALELTDIKLVTARNLSDKEIGVADFHNKPLPPKIMIHLKVRRNLKRNFHNFKLKIW